MLIILYSKLYGSPTLKKLLTLIYEMNVKKGLEILKPFRLPRKFSHPIIIKH